jgi:AcrR family transcriptional regulator
MRKTLEAKQNIKSNIEHAAARLFLERGYKGTTVRAIADQAGMTNGNIYFYYAGKEALFVSIVEPALRELRDLISSGQRMMLQADKLSPLVIKANYRRAASFFKQRRMGILVLFSGQAGSPYQGVYENLVEEMSEHVYQLACSYAYKQREQVLRDRFFYRLLGLFWVEGFFEIVRGFRDEVWAEEMLRAYVEVILTAVRNSVG